MDIILLSFIAAAGYLIILCKIFSIRFVVQTQLLWDAAFTLGTPILFLGTFSGMSTAFLSGVIFSVMTAFLGFLVPAKPAKDIVQL